MEAAYFRALELANLLLEGGLFERVDAVGEGLLEVAEDAAAFRFHDYGLHVPARRVLLVEAPAGVQLVEIIIFFVFIEKLLIFIELELPELGIEARLRRDPFAFCRCRCRAPSGRGVAASARRVPCVSSCSASRL